MLFRSKTHCIKGRPVTPHVDKKLTVRSDRPQKAELKRIPTSGVIQSPNKNPRVSMKHFNVKSSSLLRAIRSGLADPEGKESIESESGTMSVARSLVDPNAIYGFRLARFVTFTSTVGGVIDQTINNDPSALTPEWTSITSLFSQVKILKVRYTFTRLQATAIPTTTTAGGYYPIVLALNYDDVGVAGSYSGALDSPHWKAWNYAFETTGSGPTLELSFSGEHEPLWADVNTPASSTLYQGCPGNLQIYGSNIPVSTEAFGCVQELFIAFMNRY